MSHLYSVVGQRTEQKGQEEHLARTGGWRAGRSLLSLTFDALNLSHPQLLLNYGGTICPSLVRPTSDMLSANAGLIKVLITLMNHFAGKYDQPYLKEQNHLHPHPVELQLRNHV